MWGSNRGTYDYRPPSQSAGGDARPSALWGPNGSIRNGQEYNPSAPGKGIPVTYFDRSNDPNFAPNYGRPAPRTTDPTAGRIVVPGLWAGSEDSASKRTTYDGAPYRGGQNEHWGDQFLKDRNTVDTRTDLPKPVPAPTPLIDHASPYRGYYPEQSKTYEREPHLDHKEPNGYQGLIDIRNPRDPGTKR